MKCVLVCLLISVLSVNANGGGPFGGGFFGDGPGPQACGLPGGGFFGWGLDGIRGYCSCRGNPCRRVTGSLVLGCPNTNQFLQCTGQTCANQTCPTGQVWNGTQNKCAECAEGMHVAADRQVCVCNQGKTFDPRTRACVDCPTDSFQEPDKCYCNLTKAFDYKANACKDCPTGSTLLRFQQCRCNNNTQFWSEDWACKDCPGEWMPKTGRRSWTPSSKCTCTGKNQIFDRKTVTCVTCPDGTTASRDNSSCDCPSPRYQVFNKVTNKCECVKGYEADAAGTGCVRSAITTSTTTAAPGGNP